MEIVHKHLLFHNLPSLFLAFGIKNVAFEKFTIVDVLSGDKKIGKRRFEDSVAVATGLCKIMKVELEVISYEDRFKVLSLITEDSVVDIALIRHLNLSKNLVKKITILGSGLENLAITSPKVLDVIRNRKLLPQLKRRVDIIRIFILPFGISKLYTLSPNSKKAMGIKTQSLNYKKIGSILKILSSELEAINSESKFLKKLQDVKDVCLFVVPLAQAFGGTPDFNIKLINQSLQYAKENFIQTVVIKSHPADDTNYLAVFSSSIAFENEIELLQATEFFDRTIPLEILALKVPDFALYGFISSAHFTLMNFFNRGMVVALPKINQPGAVWSDYSIGYAKPIFTGTIKYI